MCRHVKVASAKGVLKMILGHKDRKLKNFLINPKYQLRYVFWVSSTGLLLISLYSILVYHYVSENYSILVELSPMEDAAKIQLYSELKEIIFKLCGGSVIFMGLVSLLGIKLSHKTAGAMFAFKKTFKKIQDGDLQARINLRPGDDFQDVAHAFNEMFEVVVKKK